jgi:hypothetical protein
MEASRAADAFGMLPGHGIEIADGESAYTQAKLGGDLTYIRIPKDRWPDGWEKKYTDPVVPLVLALYGHPDDSWRYGKCWFTRNGWFYFRIPCI